MGPCEFDGTDGKVLFYNKIMFESVEPKKPTSNCVKLNLIFGSHPHIIVVAGWARLGRQAKAAIGNRYQAGYR